MVARTIPAWSDEFKNDPGVEQAILSKMHDNTIGRGVWDPNAPNEWHDVAASDPNAVHVWAHVIVCVKNSELAKVYQKLKARVVVNGGGTRDIWGEQLEGVAIYTLPASMDSA